MVVVIYRVRCSPSICAAQVFAHTLRYSHCKGTVEKSINLVQINVFISFISCTPYHLLAIVSGGHEKKIKPHFKCLEVILIHWLSFFKIYAPNFFNGYVR